MRTWRETPRMAWRSGMALWTRKCACSKPQKGIGLVRLPVRPSCGNGRRGGKQRRRGEFHGESLQGGGFGDSGGQEIKLPGGVARKHVPPGTGRAVGVVCS